MQKWIFRFVGHGLESEGTLFFRHVKWLLMRRAGSGNEWRFFKREAWNFKYAWTPLFWLRIVIKNSSFIVAANVRTKINFKVSWKTFEIDFFAEKRENGFMAVLFSQMMFGQRRSSENAVLKTFYRLKDWKITSRSCAVWPLSYFVEFMKWFLSNLKTHNKKWNQR